MGDRKKIEYLVADTTAFLQNASLQQYAENVYTCQEVINEVTNKRQRNRLAVLPYELKVKTVFPENLDVVMEFSKKTGDYASLSLTDLKVLALTYQLEKEKVGISHIKTSPVHQKTVKFEVPQKKSDLRCNLPGWYCSDSEEESEESSDDEEESEENSGDEQESENGEDNSKQNLNSINSEDNLGTNKDASVKDVESLSETLDSLHFEAEKNIDMNTCNHFKSTEFEELKKKFENVEFKVDEEDQKLVDEMLVKVEDESDDGWITPVNSRKRRQEIDDSTGKADCRVFGETEDKEVVVACMTADFAMQNVLKQMNLNVSALNGRVIKNIRTFILRCYACFKTTSVMTKVFCPKCGNKTLKKVAVSVDEEGKMVIHINARKKISGKGKRYSLPTMKGGKHPNNPILVEDQRIPQNLPSKRALKRIDPLHDDYIAGFSPFAMRDVTSKSAQLGIRSGHRGWVPNRKRR